MSVLKIEGNQKHKKQIHNNHKIKENDKNVSFFLHLHIPCIFIKHEVIATTKDFYFKNKVRNYLNNINMENN